MAGLGGIGSLLNSDVAGLGMSMGNDIFAQLGNMGANAVNFGQYQQGLNELYPLRDRYTGGVNAVSGNYGDRYGALEGDFARQWQPMQQGLINDYNQMSQGLSGRYNTERDQSLRDYQGTMNDVNRGFDQRYTRNMNYLEGAGAQERKDIGRQFDEQQQKMAADLSERGLGGTTVLPSLSAGVERNRSDALGGLNERLNRQRLSTDASLSGDALGARERLGTGFSQFRFGSGQDQLGFDKGLQAGGIAMRQGLGQYGIENDLSNRYRSLQNQYQMDMAPIEADRQMTDRLVNYFDMFHANPPPSNSNTQAALGAMMAPEPQQPKTDWYTPLIGGASNVASGFAGGYGSQMARGYGSVPQGMYGIP
jgi:hypothetical protein